LIENRSAAIKEQANAKYRQLLSQFPDEKTLLAAYKFRNAYEMKNAIEKSIQTNIMDRQNMVELPTKQT
jgi:peptidyl-prolyl cis-trans isomerase SurA